MEKVLIINGSYRPHGVSDKICALIKSNLEKSDITVTSVFLREKDIQFCKNCRECTQIKQSSPQKCVIKDDFNSIVNMIEDTSKLILVVPTNFYSATALFKSFMERLIVYAYYPWGDKGPTLRKNPEKKMLVFSSCAAPSLIGKLFFHTNRQLKECAKILGAKVCKSTFIGECALEKEHQLSNEEKNRVIKAIKVYSNLQ